MSRGSGVNNAGVNSGFGFVTGCQESGDISALIQHALRESYLAQTKDLIHYAQKVRDINAYKKVIREALTDARNYQSAGMCHYYEQNPGEEPNDNTYLSGGQEKWVEPPENEELRRIYDQSCSDTTGTNRVNQVVELESYITTLEEELASAGDDAQLFNIDLQNALQKQQQTIQAMSNASKMLHDTATAIIRKIG